MNSLKDINKNDLFYQYIQQQNIQRLYRLMIKLDLKSKAYHQNPLIKKSSEPQTNKLLKMLQKQLQEEQPIKNKFDSICCPNCRHVFTIVNEKIEIQQKQSSEIVKKKIHKIDKITRENYLTENKDIFYRDRKENKKNKKYAEIEIQTSEFLGRISNQKKKYVSRDQPLLRPMSDRFSQRYRYSVKKKLGTDFPLSSSRQFLSNYPQQQYINTEKATSKKRLTKKQNSQKLSKNKSIQEFPVKEAYMQLNNKLQQKSEQHNISIANENIYNLKTPAKPQPQNDQILPLSELLLSEIKYKNSNIQSQHSKLHLQQQMAQIISYQMNSPQKYHVPGYCKMLAYQIQDLRQGTNKKQKLISNREIYKEEIVDDRGRGLRTQ